MDRIGSWGWPFRAGAPSRQTEQHPLYPEWIPGMQVFAQVPPVPHLSRMSNYIEHQAQFEIELRIDTAQGSVGVAKAFDIVRLAVTSRGTG